MYLGHRVRITVIGLKFEVSVRFIGLWLGLGFRCISASGELWPHTQATRGLGTRLGE